MAAVSELEPDWVDDYDDDPDERDPDMERDRDADDRADRLYEEWRDRQMGWDR